ncbi:MAG: hypothetical protein WD775_15900 [Burkholderiales bacterium]
MKRQALALVVGSLFALPAFAMDRPEPYSDAATAPSVSTSASKSRSALAAERRTSGAVFGIDEGRSIN